MIAMRATKKRSKKQKLWLSIKLLMLALLVLPLCAIGSQAQRNGYTIISSGVVFATAYNSMESQTDSTPWITASGTRCRPGVIASNFLPIGTKVMIDGFGNRVFTVEDRMNKRYKKRIDIWFRDYDDAIQFGVRQIRYHVIKTV
jgi:3D (Asp-Asp-Asp) domain-containing protein